MSKYLFLNKPYFGDICMVGRVKPLKSHEEMETIICGGNCLSYPVFHLLTWFVYLAAPMGVS